MKILQLTIMSIAFCCLFSCSKEDKNEVEGEVKDEKKPTIKLILPHSCENLKRGQSFILKATLSDNVALAAYAIDLHNNFDHHTHDNQGSKCPLSFVKKSTEKTFKFIDHFSIPNKPKKYEVSKEIFIPADADIGDYHCHISAIDVTGWSINTSVDFQIVAQDNKK